MSDVQQPPAGFWEKTAPGVKYPDLNKRLNGLPDWLRGIEEKLRPVGAGLSKAYNTLTFGAMDPLAKAISPEFHEAMKAQEAAYPGAAKAGEVAAIIPAMATGRIPAGLMVAKEAPAAAKLAAPAIRKAVDWGKAAMLAGSGAGLGGLEAGIRTATGQQEGSLAGNIATGTALGGLGGAAGSILSDRLSRLLEHLPKRTAKARLKTADMNRRDMMAVLRRQAGAGSGALKQAEEAPDVARDVAEIVKKYNLDVEGNLEKVANWQRAKWQELDKAFEAAMPDRRAANIMGDLLKPEEIADLGAKYGASAQQAADQIMKKAAQVKGLANTREMLQRTIDASFKTPDEELGAAMREIAGTLRSRVDDMVATAGEAAGVDLGMPFRQFKHEYGLLQPVARGVAREEIAPQGVVMNSPTMEKLGVAQIINKLAPTAAAGAVGAGGGALLGIKEGDTPASIAARVGAGALGGVALQRALGRGATRAIAGLDPVAQRLAALAPRVANLGRAAAMGGARAAAGAARQEATQQTAPQTPGEQKAAETGAAAGSAISTGDTSEYRNRVAERLRERWIRSGMEQYYPGQFDSFIQYAREKTGGFEPAKTAQIMFADPEERKKFLDAVEVSHTLSESIPLAENRQLGFMGLGGAKTGTPDEASSAVAYQRLQELMKGRAPKVAGAADTAYSLLNKIMGDKKLSTGQKREQVQKILADYGVAFNLMQQAGIA